MGKRVIVTRPETDSDLLAAKLRDAGFCVDIAPVISIKLLQNVKVPATPPQSIAFTSANGIRGLMAQTGAERLNQVRAIAVGPASADAARRAGFSDVVQSGGDVGALVKTIRETCRVDGGPILYSSGVHISGDLYGELTALGFCVERVVVYEAVHAGQLPEAAISALNCGQDTAVVLYSPRSALIWCSLIEQAGFGQLGVESVLYFCLSGNVEKVVRREFGDKVSTVVASRPDENAMVDALIEWRT